jgi:hypothetical protein
MSDIAKPEQPGKEKANGGNVSPAQKPAGQELASNRNGDLCHIYKDLAQ